MRKHLWAVLLLALSVPGQARTIAPAETLKQKFSSDEQWMLAVVLSDDKQKAAFDGDSAAYAQASGPEQERDVLRWRKKVAEIAAEYKKLLDTDIVQNAPSVEKMVTETEFNVTNYWLMYQPPEKQKQIMSDIALGNAVLFLRRGDVEAKIRENRKTAAAAMAAYLASKDVADAEKYQEPAAPAPKPSKAIDQLNDAAQKGKVAQNSPKPEDASQKGGETFTGSNKAGTTAPPVAAPDPVPAKSGLSPASPGVASGGLVIKAPPKAMLNREKPVQQSTLGVLAKKLGPGIGGALAGGGAGFLLGGPIGLAVGLLLGAAAGYLLGKKYVG